MASVDIEVRRATWRRYYYAHHEELVQRVRDYQHDHHEKELERGRKYRKENPEKLHRNRKVNPEKERAVNRAWCKANRDKINAKRKRQYANPDLKLKALLRVRIAKAVRGTGKAERTSELIGCSIRFLKIYLESKFLPGMTWENYGYRGWHVDHILPCASFDLTDPEQRRTCFNWRNLQPLWGVENIKKGCRVAA
jgi:hypothetical protein